MLEFSANPFETVIELPDYLKELRKESFSLKVIQFFSDKTISEVLDYYITESEEAFETENQFLEHVFKYKLYNIFDNINITYRMKTPQYLLNKFGLYGKHTLPIFDKQLSCLRPEDFKSFKEGVPESKEKQVEFLTEYIVKNMEIERQNLIENYSKYIDAGLTPEESFLNLPISIFITFLWTLSFKDLLLFLEDFLTTINNVFFPFEDMILKMLEDIDYVDSFLFKKWKESFTPLMAAKYKSLKEGTPLPAQFLENTVASAVLSEEDSFFEDPNEKKSEDIPESPQSH